MICPHVCMQHAKYCKDYPVNNYTLVINGSSFDEKEVQQFMPEKSIVSIEVSNTLPNSSLFSLQVLVSNSVGIARTNRRNICKFTVTSPMTIGAYKNILETCIP